MKKKFPFAKEYHFAIICALSMFLFCGCTPKTVVVCQSHYFNSINSTDINSEIECLEQALEKDPEIAGEESLLHLALLYSHHENTKPDYFHALELLEKHRSSDFSGDENEEVKYYISLLRQINELREKYGAMSGANLLLKKQTAAQEKDNFLLQEEKKLLQQEKENLQEKKQHLEEIIERLQQLDLQMESKRN